jgi:hypothetical protein
MAVFEGGAPLPVTTDGSGPTEPRAAVPVYVVSGGQSPLGQRARRVVVVTSGPVEGGAAHPIYDAGPGALCSAEAALPVFIVSGSNLWPLAYTSKIKALSPIAYWPMAEASGSVAQDESGNGRNGAYTGVTLGNTGIGDGRTAPSFDGATSFNNVFSASLAAAFNNQEGTIIVWFKVSAAGVWSDGVNRRILRFAADANNQVYINKSSSVNTLDIIYQANSTAKGVSSSGLGASVAFNQIAITWSKSADQVKCYLNGVQTGATATGLGVWSGALAATTTLIGAFVTTPSNVINGFLAHAAVWTTPLSAAQILSLATVP